MDLFIQLYVKMIVHFLNIMKCHEDGVHYINRIGFLAVRWTILRESRLELDCQIRGQIPNIVI